VAVRETATADLGQTEQLAKRTRTKSDRLREDLIDCGNSGGNRTFEEIDPVYLIRCYPVCAGISVGVHTTYVY